MKGKELQLFAAEPLSARLIGAEDVTQCITHFTQGCVRTKSFFHRDQ
jgi:hypothetical protein